MVHTSRYPVSTFLTLAGTIASKTFAAFTALLFTLTCMAQDQPQPQTPNSQPNAQSAPQSESVTLPPGTRIALVLTHDIQSRAMRRGDDIYAQITFPVNFGNLVVIPPGTFVQGKVDKLQQRHGRAELHLQSMSLTLPNGYVAPVAGPITLQSDEGYALKDPGQGRVLVTSNFPPGCIGGPPFCSPITTPVFGTKAKDAIIGAGIGSVIGAVASVTLLFSSHHFFLDVGTPVEMVLQQPLSLNEPQAANAVRDSEQQPVEVQPIARRPEASHPPLNTNPDTDYGTCYTAGSPGTPDTVIPGAPGPDGIPGPSTTIPGIPATPPTPYPCP